MTRAGLPATIPFDDAALPAVGVLLTNQARPLLAAALDAAGHQIGATRIAQVRYRPGRSVVVSYHADVTDAAGTRRRTTLVATSGSAIPEGAVDMVSGDLRVGVWRYPNDPVLPGLREAADADLLGALLADAGIPGGVRRIRTRSYRPTRRAVVEVTAGDRHLFLKVVRPSKAPALVDRHERVAAALPAPDVLGAHLARGLLILGAVAGRPMRDALAEPGAALPAAAELTGLLDRLPQVGHMTAGPMDRLDDHASLIAAILPELAGEVGELRHRFGALPSGTPVAVHGDFHAGQVMALDGRAHGLVDVDTAGRGDRADDLATMLGYLAARAAEPEAGTRAAVYGTRLYASFAASVGAEALRPRVGAALIGFATLPFITQRPDWPGAVAARVRRAAEWLGEGTAGLPR